MVLPLAMVLPLVSAALGDGVALVAPAGETQRCATVEGNTLVDLLQAPGNILVAAPQL